MIELGIIAIAAALTWRSTGATGKVTLVIALVAALVSAAIPASLLALGLSIATLLCAAVVLISTKRSGAPDDSRR